MFLKLVGTEQVQNLLHLMHALVLFILKKVFYFHNDYPYILHKLNVS